MLRQFLKFRPVFTLVLGLSLVCSGAFAQGHGNQGDRKEDKRGDSRGDNRGDNRRNDRGDQRGNNWGDHHGDRYHYREGRWYGRGWFGWEFAISALAIGAMVESLPPNSSVIVVGDTSYYYDNSRYYRQLPDGAYVVVQSPR